MKLYPLLFLILGSVDSNGQVTLEWVARYQGSAGDPEVSCGRDIVLDRQGNAYLTGQAVPQHDHFNILTIKYDRDGHLLWQQLYEGPRHFDFGVTLALDGLGHVYVAGTSAAAMDHGSEIVLLKYDTDGNFRWEQRYRGYLDSDRPSAIAVDGAGDIYIAGGSDREFHGEFLTLKYSADGTKLWEQHYSGPYSGNEAVNDMQLDEVGNVYITGPSSNDPQTRTFATLSYAPDGTVRWVQRYQGGIQNVPVRMAVDRQGNSHVTGFSIADGSVNYLTVKYDSEGNLVWERRYGGAGAGSGRAIAVNASGDVYVTGDLELDGARRFTTIQYSSGGILNWASTLDELPQPFDGRTSLKLDPFGSAYITATSGPLSSEVYTTFKYSLNGTLLWEDKFGVENSRNNPYGIAVDSCGNAYVTGLSQGEGWDWATLKYHSVDGVCF